MQLVHQCLCNTPARRPSAEELLQQLEAVRAQIEGPYGQIVKVDMEKVRLLREKMRALGEKDTEIRQQQQQLQQLEVGSACVLVFMMQILHGLYTVLLSTHT